MAELEKLLCTDSKVESLKKINAIADAIGDGDLANKDLSNLSTTGESKLNNLTANSANKSLTNLNTQGQLYIGKQALMSWSNPADTTGTKAFKLAEMTDVGGNNHPMGLFRWSYIDSGAKCHSFDI